MDNKLIKQYGTEILSYRLRTARQKTRLQYEDFDKQLIQLNKERNQLHQQKRNLGWQPLTPPIQRGFKRTFVLRDDVARSRNTSFYAGILQKINTVEYSSRKDFKVKKRKYGRKVYVDRIQNLQRLCAREFYKRNFSDAEKQCFYELWEMNKNKQIVKYFLFVEPWRFVLKVMPNLIDKTRIKDNVLEARIAEIDDYLERNNYDKRLYKVLDGSYGYKEWKQDVKHQYEHFYQYKNKEELMEFFEN
ncbi:MAG: hypothetical protein KBF36_04325 [Chitinophagaceae bacterium]|jgi:hypothetical protein|nr:hypothetical protein [Chitinophagaceae bacterium]MBP9739703.1 hypothetical protein [Chitinophagaceae bacterium]